jgi:hypothetical protein
MASNSRSNWLVNFNNNNNNNNNDCNNINLGADDGLELAQADFAAGVAEGAVVGDVLEVRLGHVDPVVLGGNYTIIYLLLLFIISYYEVPLRVTSLKFDSDMWIRWSWGGREAD